MARKNNYSEVRDILGRTGIKVTKRAIESDNFVTGSAGWQLTAEGNFEGSSGTFRGTITATTGNIGGWTINSTSIYTGTEDHSGYTTNAGDLTIYSDGADASIHAKNFYIDSAGVLNCASAVISGAITTTASSVLDGQYLSALSVGNAAINDLAVSKLTAGTITSKSIVLAVANGTGDVEIRSGIATGDFSNTGAANGFIIGVDDSDSDKVKFYFGNATRNVVFDGSDLTVNGYAVSTKGLFGGNGVDGALAITTGTTTISIASAKVLTKNYTSISITGDGLLAFSNPHATGSFIILKSQGAVTGTSSNDPNIQASSLGAPGGGSATDGTTAVPLTDPGTAHGGVNGGGAGTGGAVYASAGLYTIDAGRYAAFGRFLACGSGGGGSQGPGGGSGGRGGGALVIECAGDLNWTGNIDVEGGAGTLAGNGYGGGGSGGSCIIFYNTQSAVSGTISDAGGAGNTGSNDGGGGAGGIGGAGGTKSTGTSGGGAGGGGAGGTPTAGAASTSADHYIQI